MLISSPVLFPIFLGKNALEVLRRIFIRPKHLFSKDHAWVALDVSSGTVMGMILTHDFETKKKQEMNTGKILMQAIPLTMLRNVKLFMMIRGVLGIVKKNEMLVSNVAVYKKFRGRGIGKKLMRHAEILGRNRNASWMALEVETENKMALSLYRKLGYHVGWKTPRWEHQNKVLEFYRMRKPIFNCS